MRMSYVVLDEDGKMMRSFITKQEAERFLQPGWTIKYIPRVVIKRDGYSELLIKNGEAPF